MNSDTILKLSDFDYELPKELIAQEALRKRSDARLLVLDRGEKTIEHRKFSDITDYFQKGDVLVLNDTKVLPARLFAKKKTGGQVEILILRDGVQSAAKPIQVLLKPSRRVRKDEELVLTGDDKTILRVLNESDHETGTRSVQFDTDESVESILNRIGRIPLPPYINREDIPIDRELYQTVFARCAGAVASPTAGLHFDEALLGQIRKKGVPIVFVTLHVGHGTFHPVHEEHLVEHKMHGEYFLMPPEAAEVINLAKTDGRRVIACGTTAVRTLESCVHDSLPPEVREKEGETDLFIYPPYEFKIADGMITNFHLPKTTLLMLASAFAGHDFLMRAYREAIRQKYRFYSYGDGMLIL